MSRWWKSFHFGKQFLITRLTWKERRRRGEGNEAMFYNSINQKLNCWFENMQIKKGDNNS